MGFNPIEYFGGQVPDEETLEDLRKDPRFSGNIQYFPFTKCFIEMFQGDEQMLTKPNLPNVDINTYK